MHCLSTMIGEHRVKKVGQALESFRHTTLPVAASRQERTPPTPSVQTLPSASAGELRAPGCPPAGPVTATAAYLSFHRSVPLAAPRHDVTSPAPRRVKAAT